MAFGSVRWWRPRGNSSLQKPISDEEPDRHVHGREPRRPRTADGMRSMPKFGIPGLEPGRWSPGRGRFGSSKEKLKADPNHTTRPNLPTALAQHTPSSASAASIPQSSSPSSDDTSSLRRRSSKPNGPMAATDVPAYHPAVGMQHLLSAREMASHPNNVPAEVVLHLMGVTNVPRNESLNISSLSTYVVAWVSAPMDSQP